MNRRLTWLALLALAVGVGLWFWLAASALIWDPAVRGAPAPGTVSGVVVNLDGDPVAGAVVRQRTTTLVTNSEPDGAFLLSGLTDGIEVGITAWQEGYQVGGAYITPPAENITIALKLHYTVDDPEYQFFASSVPEIGMSCMHCMVAHPQWEVNAHGTSAVNPRFFSVYNGTQAMTTTVASPGYKLDFPDAAGNCAACHAPIAAVEGVATPLGIPATITGTFTADMNELAGVELEGSHCEFCHKVGEVYLDSATGLPFVNAPGVFSMRLWRSPPDEVLWFGPFDDVLRRVSYLPLEKTSQFCAPCHQFSFFGTPIYESFGEWLASDYPAQGIECQTCHMAPTGIDYFAKPSVGGLIRDPDLIASHLQPGAFDEELLQNTVSMAISSVAHVGDVSVTVTISNTGAGHHVPTDHPGRHMILVVTAEDMHGRQLPLRTGPTVPDWGGQQAELAGTAFAKVLQDQASGEMPVISYWKPTTIASDNRIPALGSDISNYRFAGPLAKGPVTITAELRFRRLYEPLMTAKDWSTPDIMMEVEQTTVTAGVWHRHLLPVILRAH